jgi:hypothetical protein
MGAQGSGKCEHQKLKPYLILQILQEKTDEEHLLTAAQIAAELDEMGIEAERRSIYRDIREINRVQYAGKRLLLPGGGSAFPRRSGPGP